MLLGPSLLRGRDSDGFPKYQEKFIRDCIRKFPYCEATLLQQMVRSIVMRSQRSEAQYQFHSLFRIS